MADKKQYEAPALTVVGTFESITQSTYSGGTADAAFPAIPGRTNDYS